MDLVDPFLEQKGERLTEPTVRTVGQLETHLDFFCSISKDWVTHHSPYIPPVGRAIYPNIAPLGLLSGSENGLVSHLCRQPQSIHSPPTDRDKHMADN